MKPTQNSLMDKHRLIPKAQGGKCEKGNVDVLEPPDHAEIHGTLRQERFEELKAIMDDRFQIMKATMKVGNQLLAYKRRTDNLNPATTKWLEEEAKRMKRELAQRTRLAEKAIKGLAEVDPLVKAAIEVRGVGPVTVAFCTVYIDLTKARHASSLWKYTGLHCASHERYTKNVASGGNKTLRTALYTMAEAQMKCGGAYRPVYDRVKARLESSQKAVKSRNTQGHLVEVPWCETKPCHRHGAALRAVMKAFLADYWFVGRELLGLPNGPCYAEAQLGGDHKTVSPRERGWEW